MRIVFMGTPEFAATVFTKILGAGHRIAAVYTRAPKPGGRRGLAPTPSPVHLAACRADVRVLTPSTLRSKEAAAIMHDLEPEVLVVVAYGLILPRAIFEIPIKGSLNLHPSLLPRWRGAAPIQRAIMAGDRETGVSIMSMTEELDAGPVALSGRVEIGPDCNAGELAETLAAKGADVMLRALAEIERGDLVFKPQPSVGVTYACKIEKAEAKIDWERSAADLHNLIRGLSPAPGAFFEADLGKGIERIKVLRAEKVEGFGEPGLVLDNGLTIACGEGAIHLLAVQRSGKAVMKAVDFLRGANLAAGARLSARFDGARHEANAAL